MSMLMRSQKRRPSSSSSKVPQAVHSTWVTGQVQQPGPWPWAAGRTAHWAPGWQGGSCREEMLAVIKSESCPSSGESRTAMASPHPCSSSQAGLGTFPLCPWQRQLASQPGQEIILPSGSALWWRMDSSRLLRTALGVQGMKVPLRALHLEDGGWDVTAPGRLHCLGSAIRKVLCCAIFQLDLPLPSPAHSKPTPANHPNPADL
ncbi:hypothetical protein QTO34_016987 [Cnephaeus nilssonii]|uniref:Uncharacterized protein n=1 Tax=Cnephaeus nilssonii TaxID=3371016 RepID=A0AA40I391_CNENI|nr:hypothetical protein QTO34_016987 [Eptesicus nilssonii]